MSAPRIQQRFAIGETVWAVNPYGSIISGPVSDTSRIGPGPAVHYIAHGGVEVVAHPAFATEAEAVAYRLNEVEVEVFVLKARLRTLEGGRVADAMIAARKGGES